VRKDEIEKIKMELDGLKKLQKKVGFNVVECMERITKLERYWGFSSKKK